MHSRRTVLKRVVMGIAAAALPETLPGAGVSASAMPVGHPKDSPATPTPPSEAEAPAPAAEPHWQLLAPLGPGDAVGLGFRLASLSPVTAGGAVLMLSRAGGQEARVHICRHDGQPRGMAHTRKLDLILMNGGRGDTPTNEELGRVLLGLAARLAANEKRAAELIRSMQTHEERLRLYAGTGVLA